MNTIKKTRIENMLSTYQELTDWADKEVIPKLYKFGIIDSLEIDGFELNEDHISIIYLPNDQREGDDVMEFHLFYEWYYDPETLDKYIKDYLKALK